MSIYIRDAKLGDQPVINDLAYSLYLDHHKSRPDIFKEPEDAFSIELLEKLINSTSDHVIVACNTQETVLGYAYFSFKKTSQSELCYERKFTEITELCIRGNERRQGIASKLHYEIVKRAQKSGHPTLELDVWFFNEGAISFYKTLGFSDKNMKMELTSNK